MDISSSEILALSDQGLTDEEIGRRTGLSGAAVRGRRRRAAKQRAKSAKRIKVDGTDWRADPTASFDADPVTQRIQSETGSQAPINVYWDKYKLDDGRSVSVQRVRPKPGAQEWTPERWASAFAAVPAKLPTPAPARPDDGTGDLLALYVLTDWHMGMLAWGTETGWESYDVSHAGRDLLQSSARVMAMTAAGVPAVLVINGDAFHASSDEGVTDQSKHKLDTDGRHERVLAAGLEALAAVIDAMLARHASLEVCIVKGNHGGIADMGLRMGLGQRYRLEPRLTVLDWTRAYYAKRHGDTLLLAAHGHTGAPKAIVDKIADECEHWKPKQHRYLFTGHKHSMAAQRIGGVWWEQLDAFCPPDSYGMRFVGRRMLHSMTIDAAKGMIARAMDPVQRETPA